MAKELHRAVCPSVVRDRGNSALFTLGPCAFCPLLPGSPLGPHSTLTLSRDLKTLVVASQVLCCLDLDPHSSIMMDLGSNPYYLNFHTLLPESKG